MKIFYMTRENIDVMSCAITFDNSSIILLSTFYVPICLFLDLICLPFV